MSDLCTCDCGLVGDNNKQFASALVSVAWRLIHGATARHIVYKARVECRRGEEVQGERNAEATPTDHGVIDLPLHTKNRQLGTTMSDARLMNHSGYGHCCAPRLNCDMLHVTLPYAIENKMCVTSRHWLKQYYQSMSSFTAKMLLPEEQGYCAMGARLEVIALHMLMYVHASCLLMS